MHRADLHALGEVAGEASAAVAGLVSDTHAGIAARVFGALGPVADAVRIVHDAISGVVHASVASALRAGARVGAQLAATRAPRHATAVSVRPGASVALRALNGLYGDHLAGRHSRLDLGLDIRCGGAPVALSREDLAEAFADATGRIVVFVHGLCETEAAWELPARRTGPGERRTYGRRLRDELGFTPVYVRYNSGLRVSANGRRLAEALDRLVSAWPVDVAEVALIGHSMGGLVARSACHYGGREGQRFARLVRHVFCLGTPHLGADLEKATNVLAYTLGCLRETRGFEALLNRRSAGIKDLRYGSCVEEDWQGRDPDELLRDRCQEVAFLPNAGYYFIGAQFARGPLGAALGDLLVRMPSASGRGGPRGRSIPVAIDHGREVHGLTHFDLLGHPTVYEQIRTWMASCPASPDDARAPVARAGP